MGAASNFSESPVEIVIAETGFSSTSFVTAGFDPVIQRPTEMSAFFALDGRLKDGHDSDSKRRIRFLHTPRLRRDDVRATRRRLKLR
jgi:hypothetical protein